MRAMYPLDRATPPGSLTLEKLMELYHVDKQRVFYYALVRSNGEYLGALSFDGTIDFNKYEHGKFPVLGGFVQQHSIRDLNLVPNTYTRHFVFASEEDAQQYIDTI